MEFIAHTRRTWLTSVLTWHCSNSLTSVHFFPVGVPLTTLQPALPSLPVRWGTTDDSATSFATSYPDPSLIVGAPLTTLQPVVFPSVPDCWGTTDDSATSSLHPFLSSTALWELANSSLVHLLMLSSHLFFCLPLLLSTSSSVYLFFCPPLLLSTSSTSTSYGTL